MKISKVELSDMLGEIGVLFTESYKYMDQQNSSKFGSCQTACQAKLGIISASRTSDFVPKIKLNILRIF